MPNPLYMPFDMLYVYLVLIPLAFTIWAQIKIKSNFKKYSQQRTQRGITGAQAAYEVLRRAGVSGVRIERVGGKLTDHFDPRTNVIRLSEAVHDTASVTAVGVAAHEAGHAIQYATAYAPMKFRSAIIHVTNFGSKLSLPLIILGSIMGMTGLINLGIFLFGLVVVFQLVTLPVEFNASRRAVKILSESGLLTQEEIPGSKKVLSAAALTYIAALAVSLGQLLRFVLMARRRR